MRVSSIAGASVNPGVVIHGLEWTHRALPQGESRFLKSLILSKTHPETNFRSDGQAVGCGLNGTYTRDRKYLCGVDIDDISSDRIVQLESCGANEGSMYRNSSSKSSGFDESCLFISQCHVSFKSFSLK